MKTCGFVLFMLASALMLTGNALAQNAGDNSVYFVTYYSNANTAGTISTEVTGAVATGAPDAVVRIINDGDQATSDREGVENGPLWASFYIFDDSEELRSCCACLVTADGLLSESVNKQLTSDEFTGRGQISRGVIKVVSSSTNDPTNPVATPGLRGWATHIQAATNLPETGPFLVTETPLADSNLGRIELSNLAISCSYGLTLGSGYGNCPCTPEDHDF
jgi:hypothetical protein